MIQLLTLSNINEDIKYSDEEYYNIECVEDDKNSVSWGDNSSEDDNLCSMFKETLKVSNNTHIIQDHDPISCKIESDQYIILTNSRGSQIRCWIIDGQQFDKHYLFKKVISLDKINDDIIQLKILFT